MRRTVFISKVKRDSTAYSLMIRACEAALQEGRSFMVQDVYCEVIGSATEFHIEQPEPGDVIEDCQLVPQD